MEDLTDRELLDLVDSAMQTVVARFKAKREAADASHELPSPKPRETQPTP